MSTFGSVKKKFKTSINYISDTYGVSMDIFVSVKYL